MDFSEALIELKKGSKICRSDWNRKGMWLILICYEDTKYYDEETDNTYSFLPAIAMKTVDDKFLIGWLASQTDILAEDWEIYE